MHSNAFRLLALTGAAGALLTGSLVTGSAANAAAPAADCQATGSAPTKINLKPKPQTVRFTLTTTCPAGTKIGWYFQAFFPEDVPHTEHYPYIQLANYNVGPANWYQDAEGDYPMHVSSAGNLLAGQTMQAGYSWFVDTGTPGNSGEEHTGFTAPLTVYRATRVIDAAVDKTSVNQGDFLSFSASAQRANWETGTWQTFSDVQLLTIQFRAEGTTSWKTVEKGSSLVEATTSGDYRLRYTGDKWSGASNSPLLHVTVN